MRMTVLGIDTATSRGSVALAREGEVLTSGDLHERGAHARDLVQRIDRLLAGTGLGPGDLQGIVVTLGPGSFTGVRVGLSTAKGLAYALDIGLGEESVDPPHEVPGVRATLEESGGGEDLTMTRQRHASPGGRRVDSQHRHVHRVADGIPGQAAPRPPRRRNSVTWASW